MGLVISKVMGLWLGLGMDIEIGIRDFFRNFLEIFGFEIWTSEIFFQSFFFEIFN